ncbi:MAG TPA: hypothetical protein VF593_14135 [Chthoniobacteraceae bacterium]|jgi:xylan 1,4-beta-xylosidase
MFRIPALIAAASFGLLQFASAVDPVATPAPAAAPAVTAPVAPAPNFPVTIRIDASKKAGEMRPIWRYFGYDEPNYTYMKNGKKLIGELGKLGKHGGFVRTHSLLVTGDGTPALKWGSTNAYTEDANGKPVYDWTIVDRIFDTYLQNGLKPYVQIGFMPKALSSKPEPYEHHWKPGDPYNSIYTGWTYPPNDYDKWRELVFQWTKHCVDKYGQAEAESWWWQLWNEPNLKYWNGTQEEFFKLYDYTVDGVRRALPKAKVGGPETAGGPGGNWMRNFFEHCLNGTNYVTGQKGTPLDFLSFHAKGSPKFVEGHVRMGMSSQLQNIDSAFSLIAKYPQLKDKPIVIGESDPDGCAACTGAHLGYRNGTMYSSYTAASFARKYELADKHGVNLEGALTWAFQFEDKPYFAGFRVLANNGIDLPVMNVFRMFGKMSGQRLPVESSATVPLEVVRKTGVREAADVSAMASLDQKKLSVMTWHYHDDDVAGPVADLEIALTGLPVPNGNARIQQFRVDAEHSNSFEVWKSIGSPQQPTPEQYARLEKAGQLAAAGPASTIAVKDGAATLKVSLARQAVSLFVIEW